MALPQDDLGAGAPQCQRLHVSSPQSSSAFCECPPAHANDRTHTSTLTARLIPGVPDSFRAYLRALPQGGVELQQWKPSPRDWLQMAMELLLLLLMFCVDIPCGAFDVIELLAIYTLCQRLVLPQARSRNQQPILYPRLHGAAVFVSVIVMSFSRLASTD